MEHSFPDIHKPSVPQKESYLEKNQTKTNKNILGILGQILVQEQDMSQSFSLSSKVGDGGWSCLSVVVLPI